MFMGFGLIFTILLVVGFVYLLNSRGQSLNNLISTSADNGKSPLEIAQERYAPGSRLIKKLTSKLRHDLSG